MALLCAKYAPFGLIPLPIPILFPTCRSIDKIPAQKGTDLQYIREMAEDVGYVFYIEPGSVAGTNIAYFGPEIKIGIPQPALNLDMDALTNVESLNFTFDPTKVLPIVFIQNQMTRVPIPIPIPNINPLQPPLGVLSTPIANLDPQRHGEAQSHAGDLARFGGSEEVTGFGERDRHLDVLRYGRVEGARTGRRARCRPRLQRPVLRAEREELAQPREFKQNFTLTRNGLISMTPRVPYETEVFKEVSGWCSTTSTRCS